MTIAGRALNNCTLDAPGAKRRPGAYVIGARRSRLAPDIIPMHESACSVGVAVFSLYFEAL